MRALQINQHKVHLTNILMDIYKNSLLSGVLGFKGGTAGMLFYGLPRFSVDLDFDFLSDSQKGNTLIATVTKEIGDIVESKYTVIDKSTKLNTLFWVLSYGKGFSHVKIEISTREVPYNHYTLQNYYGTSIKLITAPDMVAHKMVAIMDRTTTANKDLFDTHYFLGSKYAGDINYHIIKHRTDLEPHDFYKRLLEFLDGVNNKNILSGLGEVLTEPQKNWAKAKLLEELKGLIGRQLSLLHQN